GGRGRPRQPGRARRGAPGGPAGPHGSRWWPLASTAAADRPSRPREAPAARADPRWRPTAGLDGSRSPAGRRATHDGDRPAGRIGIHPARRLGLERATRPAHAALLPALDRVRVDGRSGPPILLAGARHAPRGAVCRVPAAPSRAVHPFLRVVSRATRI